MKAYPVYRLRATVEYPIPLGEENTERMRYRALHDRPGWYQEKFSGERMVRHGLLDRRMHHQELAKWFAMKLEQDPQADLIRAELTYVGHKTWASGWFDHFRIDTGESDSEVLASFEDYVEGVQVHNERMLRRVSWPDRKSYHQNRDHPDAIQLMGAEDRYRWCGTEDGAAGMLGVMSGRTDPPCRCDGCGANGIVRICH